MINRVIIVGRLTKDVEVRHTTTGKAVAQFTVACDRKGKADFINCIAWNQIGEALAKNKHKGDLIGVDGHLQTRSYEKDGRTVYVTEVLADEIQYMGGLSELGREIPSEELPF